MLARDDEQQIGQFHEVLISQGELAERVARARIEARRNQHQFRLETRCGRHEPFAKGFQDLRSAGTCWKRVIDDQAARLAIALLCRTAGPGIPRMLMDIEEQHRTIAPENLLRAITVMHVPVGDEDSVDTMTLGSVKGPDG